MANSEENDGPTLSSGVPQDSPTTSVRDHVTLPDAAEILHKFEDLFSNDRLPEDAHLLAKAGGDGNGVVSISSIIHDKKLRYKPLSAVREVLKQSKSLEVVGGKHIKRRFPLTVPLRVQPKLAYDAEKWKPPADKPWLTKNMMKPTGFEEGAVDEPLSSTEMEENQDLYHPDKSFADRIETAIALFRRKRKFHEQQLAVFEKWMKLGGVDGGPRAFAGRMSKEDLEGLTKEELATRISQHKVSELVIAGLEGGNDEPTWTVDFEGVAKCFLSTVYLEIFDWTSSDHVKIAVNILRNFYHYLTLHGVCPEYQTQLEAACTVCNVAEDELPKLWKASALLPGDCNRACSQQCRGLQADLYSSGTAEWETGEEETGWSEKDALVIIIATISAYGTDEQVTQMEAVATGALELSLKASEVVGLEVTKVERPYADAQGIFDAAAATTTCVKPVGKLHARRWELPYAAPADLPTSVGCAGKQDEFVFFVDQETLNSCYPGLKFEAVVKDLDIGIKFIDNVETVFPSFYTYLLNERVREWKEPGPPKRWMKGHLAKEIGENLEEEEHHHEFNATDHDGGQNGSVTDDD